MIKAFFNKSFMKQLFWNFLNRILPINYKSPLSGLCRKCFSVTNHIFIYIYIMFTFLLTKKTVNMKLKSATR